MEINQLNTLRAGLQSRRAKAVGRARVYLELARAFAYDSTPIASPMPIGTNRSSPFATLDGDRSWPRPVEGTDGSARTMFDFEVQRCTRRCAKSDRELAPGETFYSALIAEGANVARRDYAASAWDGPPDGALGWWKSQMPSADVRKVHWAPNDVILHYFEQLENQPDQQDKRYLLALLMVRRRIVRLEETQRDDPSGEVLVLFCPRTELEYRVPVVTPTGERIAEIQQELARMLYAHAA